MSCLKYSPAVFPVSCLKDLIGFSNQINFPGRIPLYFFVNWKERAIVSTENLLFKSVNFAASMFFGFLWIFCLSFKSKKLQVKA